MAASAGVDVGRRSPRRQSAAETITLNHRRGAGRRVRRRSVARWRGLRRWRIFRPRLLRRRRRWLLRLRELPRLSRSRCLLRQTRTVAMDIGCRDERDREDNGKCGPIRITAPPMHANPQRQRRMRRSSSVQLPPPEIPDPVRRKPTY
jgi:hypothetical protein